MLVGWFLDVVDYVIVGYGQSHIFMKQEGTFIYQECQCSVCCTCEI